MREQRELQTLIDQLERYIKEQDEQIDSLLKTVEALVVDCEQAAIEEREAINLDHRLAQASGAKKGKKGFWEFDEHELKKFIELSRESEREACAALVEADNRVHPKAPDFVWKKTVAKLIRARGNK